LEALLSEARKFRSKLSEILPKFVDASEALGNVFVVELSD